MASGEWRIFIPREEFKNIRGVARNKDYDQAVDESVWPFTEGYLKTHRAALGASNTDLVFVSTDAPNRPWAAGLGRRVQLLTRRYVPGCPGAGPHAFRHIVATSIIMKNSRDYLLAADSLHDDPETMRKHYAILLAASEIAAGAKCWAATTLNCISLHCRLNRTSR